MIRVTLRSKGNVLTGFACRGHAGYAPHGQDIVCAAVSALTTTCVNALESVAGVKPLVKVGEGKMIAVLPKGAGHDAQVLLLALRQGLRDIAQEYPEYFLLTEN